MDGIRINRYLADAGLGSRRGVEELIRSGKVKIDGEVLSDLAFRVDGDVHRVEVAGKLISSESKKTGSEAQVWIYHKPRGPLCTRTDPMGRSTIWEDMSHLPPPYQAVGRLDGDSRGLLLISRRGDLTERLMHPRYEVEKIYRVEAKGRWSESKVSKLEAGVEMEEGGEGKAEVLEQRPMKGGVELLLRLRRGKKREIRYSLKALEMEVTDLLREKLLFLELGDLPEKGSRPLSEGEMSQLLEKVELSPL
jgi:23S rRNA pseudouridine2605 synthase